MSKLRDASALFIEAGRALGRSELAGHAARQLRELAHINPLIGDLATQYENRQQREDTAARDAQARAGRLLAAIEHPGARLARRLVMAVRAARAAWHRHD